MLRFVIEGLLIYFIVHTLWGLFRPGRPSRSDNGKPRRRSTKPGRFDTGDRDVSDADYEDIAD